MHGVCSSALYTHTDDFADDAFDGTLSQAWISNMTDFDFWCTGGTNCDLCGLSRTMGNTTSDCNARRAAEYYSYFWPYDPPDTGEVSINHYFCNCDPIDEDPLPDC